MVLRKNRGFFLTSCGLDSIGSRRPVPGTHPPADRQGNSRRYPRPREQCAVVGLQFSCRHTRTPDARPTDRRLRRERGRNPPDRSVPAFTGRTRREGVAIVTPCAPCRIIRHAPGRDTGSFALHHQRKLVVILRTGKTETRATSVSWWWRRCEHVFNAVGHPAPPPRADARGSRAHALRIAFAFSIRSPSHQRKLVVEALRTRFQCCRSSGASTSG